ncbi:MAG TPA: arginase family protein [Oscillatoriaceae cyanobacterium]
MSLTPNASLPTTLRAIVAGSHPGGRYPGVMLPPTWFEADVPQVAIDSALPQSGDAPAIQAGVHGMCRAIRDTALEALRRGEHPMLVGGDHSLAMGTLAATTTQYERVAVIWIDAHADFNTLETSPSGNPHGMPLAVAVGLGMPLFTGLYSRHVEPQDVLLVAARAIDPEEAELLARQGIWHVSVPELRGMGVDALVRAARERFEGAKVHLSFDFDAIDSEFFSATGTPVAEGLTPDEGEALLKAIAASGMPVVSNDWVEFDPRPESAASCAQIARRLYKAFHG